MLIEFRWYTEYNFFQAERRLWGFPCIAAFASFNILSQRVFNG